jgi:hypothetical protein
MLIGRSNSKIKPEMKSLKMFCKPKQRLRALGGYPYFRSQFDREPPAVHSIVSPEPRFAAAASSAAIEWVSAGCCRAQTRSANRGLSQSKIAMIADFLIP